MNNKPDNNGRYSLSGREYYALRELFAAVDGFNRNACELEKRVRTIPNGYRDLRMLQSVSAKLMRDILETVPVKKLAQIRRELSSSEMILRVKPINPKENEYDDNLTYVPQQALERFAVRRSNSNASVARRKPAKRRNASFAKTYRTPTCLITRTTARRVRSPGQRLIGRRRVMVDRED